MASVIIPVTEVGQWGSSRYSHMKIIWIVILSPALTFVHVLLLQVFWVLCMPDFLLLFLFCFTLILVRSTITTSSIWKASSKLVTWIRFINLVQQIQIHPIPVQPPSQNNTLLICQYRWQFRPIHNQTSFCITSKGMIPFFLVHLWANFFSLLSPQKIECGDCSWLIFLFRQFFLHCQNKCKNVNNNIKPYSYIITYFIINSYFIVLSLVIGPLQGRENKEDPHCYWYCEYGLVCVIGEVAESCLQFIVLFGLLFWGRFGWVHG